jgi:hypothetical protein
MTPSPAPVYKIEGGIDFYKELLEFESESNTATSNTTSTISTTSTTNTDTTSSAGKSDACCEKCLLTNQPLSYGHITLPCGHKFNFLPLYTETLYQKTNPAFVKNVYNTPIGKDKLKCPYCRTVHTGALLPYIVNERRVPGVNAPVKLCARAPFKCEHVSTSANQKRRTPCRSFVNLHYVPATDTGTGNAMFLCRRHLTLTQSKTHVAQLK